jgi:hypothetical protein
VKHPLDVQRLVLERGDGAGGQVEPGGSEPSPRRDARARLLCRARLRIRDPFASGARRGRDLRSDQTAEQSVLELEGGVGLQLREVVRVEHVIRADVGHGLAGQPEHLGPLLRDHLLQQSLHRGKKSSTDRFMPPATPAVNHRHP